MKRFLKTSATGLIVALGLSAGQTTAEVRTGHTVISQATCEASLFHSKRPVHKLHKQKTGTVFHRAKELSVDDWPAPALDLLGALNNKDFEEGSLNIVDCVGSLDTVRVRTQRFELEHFNRQGSERRGWRFNAEAQNLDEPVLRLVRLELPPSHLWQTNSAGNGLVAATKILHARNNEGLGRFPRIRTTEVTPVNGALLVTQRTTTNGQFDELVTWTLK